MTNVVLNNINWTIEQVAVFFAAAGNVSTSNRSPFYKASYFFAASTVEALTFLIIKKFCSENKIDYGNGTTYKLIHNFPSGIFANRKGNVGIFEKTKNEFQWKDHIDLKDLNSIGVKNRIFTKRFYDKLERIRTKRNRIHIQSLSTKDHSYQKKDVEYVSSAIPTLLDIGAKYGITS